jgi:hypothetical protein
MPDAEMPTAAALVSMPMPSYGTMAETGKKPLTIQLYTEFRIWGTALDYHL